MSKIGRNQPCPCDSGRKYKRCCLPIHERALAAQRIPVAEEQFGDYFARCDELANRVIYLLEQDRIEDAEKAARYYFAEYPDDPQALERLAMVYDAWGKKSKAAWVFRQAAAMHEVVLQANPMTAAWLRDQADRMDQGLDIEWPDGDLDGPDDDIK